VTSKLASLLVQEGLISPKKMAEAFQRQVIYGGALDTILLEMELLDEHVLIEAMGRASGLPTAGDLPSREALDAAGVTKWFPQALIEKYRAVPVAVDGNVVRVLVTDPPDRRQLDELGYQLSRSIDPIVVPEHRFAHAVELVYSIPVPARFSSLAAKIRQRNGEEAMPPSRPAPSVVPQAKLPEVPVEPTPRSAVVEPAAPRVSNDESATPRITLREADAPKPLTTEVTQPVSSVMSGSDVTPMLLKEAIAAIDGATERDAILEALCRGARARLEFVALFMVHGGTAAGRMALGAEWLPREMLGTLSINLETSSAFRTAVQTRSPYLGKIGEEAAGPALHKLGRKPPLPAVLLPVVLKERTVALVYGDAGGKPIDVGLLGELSTAVSAAARGFQRLILRQKGADYSTASTGGAAAKVAAAVENPAKTKSPGAGWRKADDVDTAKLDAVKPVAAPQTVEMTAEPTGPIPVAMMPDSPSVEIETQMEMDADPALTADDRDLPRSPSSRDGRERRSTVVGFRPLGTDVPLLAAAQAAVSGPAMTDADALILSVTGEDEHARMSVEALLLLNDRGAEAVVKQMPGPLKIDRHALRGPMPPLAEHGPLLAALGRFGAVAAKPLAARLADPSIEVRFYATLALGPLKVPSTVPALGQRLWDADAGVRNAAATGLARFEIGPEMRALTESLRGELPGPDQQRQQHAAEALGILRDVPSVPRLIELVKHPEAALARVARRALIDITKQDFTNSRWRWRAWWERHRHEPRLEWMLEGLSHNESDVRTSAAEELRALGGGETFGYYADQPKREREEARRRWTEWWRKKSPEARPR
jgi:hypothetical protein